MMNLNRKLEILISKFENIKSLSVFGFKERMSIEKILYSILLDVTNETPSGFNKIEFIGLKDKYKEDKSTLSIIIRLFELRTFIKEISSGSTYVRDLALERVNTNRIDVFKFIDNQLLKLKKEIKEYR